MTPEKQQIALCEWMGWKKNHLGLWQSPVSNITLCTPELPDTSSLDVLHEMEKKLDGKYLNIYLDNLCAGMKYRWQEVFATASQRREALLRTIGKWEE